MGMRIYPIAPGLLLSARTHQLSDVEVADLIKNWKITGIVNLWHTRDPRAAALVRWYMHESMPDGKAHDNFMLVAEYLADNIALNIRKDNDTVLCHCWGGRNRSGLVVALALMRLQGITGKEAIVAVKAVRSGALVNKHFVAYLEGHA